MYPFISKKELYDGANKAIGYKPNIRNMYPL